MERAAVEVADERYLRFVRSGFTALFWFFCGALWACWSARLLTPSATAAPHGRSQSVSTYRAPGHVKHPHHDR